MSLHPDTLYRIALKNIPAAGAVTARNLVSYCGSVRKVFDTRKSKLVKIPGVGETLASRIVKKESLVYAEREVEYVIKHDIDVHFYLDQTYPTRLKHIHQAPVLIYTRGSVGLNRPRVVAIVGTRRPTSYGRGVVASLVSDLAEYNPVIVSGLAYGIDIDAHRAALKTGLDTVGVMANGLSRIYPRQHRETATRMVEQGGLLTEFDHDVKPEKDQFPARNRIIAGLADVVLVVETGVMGGSIITAEFANSFNRDVAAIPGRISDENSKGCNTLISTHKAHMVTSGQSLAELMSWDASAVQPVKQVRLFDDLSDSEKLVMETICESNPTEFELIRVRSNLRSSELASVLLSLEFKGVVRTLPGQRFQRM